VYARSRSGSDSGEVRIEAGDDHARAALGRWSLVRTD
jgi:hypothetical protein